MNTVTPNSPEQIVAAVFNKGPVTSSINAHDPSFKLYTGGVLNNKNCSTSITHAVLIVGYSDNYFIVRNSFGPFWGEDGYVRVERVEGPGICGLQQAPAYPDTN